ncbi:signal peptidase I [Aquipuribacter sp. MA13-6]|uniref:signal peptidase I n=1 Tax=unclassified Aquipuribacter TaxID=2635084 RepID=UPI003EE845BF
MVSGDSMAPTLLAGQVVLLMRTADPDRRDVVAVRSPVDGAVVLKRVVATGGQEVGVADGVLLIDGVRVTEDVDPKTVDGTWFGPVVVPPRSVFVLGDHRERSIDSRHHGAVLLDDVVGVAVLRVRPPSRIEDLIDDP